jgi:hypothetical protein
MHRNYSFRSFHSFRTRVPQSVLMRIQVGAAGITKHHGGGNDFRPTAACDSAMPRPQPIRTQENGAPENGGSASTAGVRLVGRGIGERGRRQADADDTQAAGRVGCEELWRQDLSMGTSFNSDLRAARCDGRPDGRQSTLSQKSPLAGVHQIQTTDGLLCNRTSGRRA